MQRYIPLESADYYHATDANIVITAPYKTYCGEERCIPAYKGAVPCWSLSALLDVLPEIQGFEPIIARRYNYIAYPHTSDLYTKADNLVDACYEMIIQLNEIKML